MANGFWGATINIFNVESLHEFYFLCTMRRGGGGGGGGGGGEGWGLFLVMHAALLSLSNQPFGACSLSFFFFFSYTCFYTADTCDVSIGVPTRSSNS